MNSFRFSISEILVAMAVLAAIIATVTNGSWMSARFLSAFAVIINLTAMLLAHRKEHSRRSFWIGFALFGLTYLIATDFLSISNSTNQFPVVELDRLLRGVIEGEQHYLYVGDGDRIDAVNSRRLIANSLGHLIFASVGGLIGLVVYAGGCPRDSIVSMDGNELRDN